MARKVIALSARAAAQLPSIPETQRQLKAGYLEGSTRLDIRELEAMKRDYVFAIVTTHDRWEVVEVLAKLGLSPYCPSDHIIVSAKGERQNIDNWRRWRAEFEKAGGLLVAVIDHTGSGSGSVVHALGSVPDFENVNRYFWPYDSDDRTPSTAMRIDRLSDTEEYQIATQK